MTEKDTEQYMLQNEQYKFPYHWAQFEQRFNHFSNYHGKIYYTVFMRHVIDVIKELRPTSILDVGCGDGVLISTLQSEGIGVKWGGVDVSSEAIAFARAFNNHVEWFCGDFRDEVNEEYNLITCTEVLEHIPDEMISGFIQGLFDKLKIGGKLLITVPTIAMPVSPKHFRHYSIELLEKELKEVGVAYRMVKKHNYIKRTWLWNSYMRIFFCGQVFCRINWLESKAYGYFKWCASRCKNDLDGEKLIVVLEKQKVKH